MAFDVSTLDNYTDEQSRDLIARMYFENTTSEHVNMQPGIKSSWDIHLINPSAPPQEDTGCGFNASGDTSLTARTLTVAPYKYNSELCLAALEAKWTQILMKEGSQAGREDVSNAVLRAVEDAILLQVQEDAERMDWQGDTDKADQYFDKYDGFIKIIDAASGVVDGNTSSATEITSGSSGNVATLINDMAMARPAALRRKTGQKLFVGTDTFDKYIQTLIDKNLFHIDPTNQGASYEYVIPGKSITVVGVHGLDGTDRMFLGHEENFWIGVDGMSDEDAFDMWYSKDDDIIKYKVRLKRGVQIAYPSEIVEFTLS